MEQNPADAQIPVTNKDPTSESPSIFHYFPSHLLANRESNLFVQIHLLQQGFPSVTRGSPHGTWSLRYENPADEQMSTKNSDFNLYFQVSYFLFPAFAFKANKAGRASLQSQRCLGKDACLEVSTLCAIGFSKHFTSSQPARLLSS